MAKTLIFVSVLGALMLIPSAAAHTTVATTDGKYLVTVGNLNEPVSTFTKTGLDLAVRANATARPGISGAHLTLTATLMAPGGQQLSEALVARFGAVGSYSFEEPYYLTQPGEYRLRLTGQINETVVDFAGILVGSGPIPAFEALTFPDDVQNQKQLEDRIKSLETEVATLKAENGNAGGNAPALDGILILGILGAIGVVAARRRAA